MKCAKKFLVAGGVIGLLAMSAVLAQPNSQSSADRQFEKTHGRMPGPGENLPPGILSGSELGQYDDQYAELKRFWGDDVVSKAFDNATKNSSEYISSTWTKYGFVVTAKASWEKRLGAAAKAASAGDWKTVIAECNASLAENNHALDAYLLRTVAYRKLNQAGSAGKNINDTRKNAQDFLNRVNGNPQKLHGFQDVQNSLKSK